MLRVLKKDVADMTAELASQNQKLSNFLSSLKPVGDTSRQHVSLCKTKSKVKRKVPRCASCLTMPSGKENMAVTPIKTRVTGKATEKAGRNTTGSTKLSRSTLVMKRSPMKEMASVYLVMINNRSKKK